MIECARRVLLTGVLVFIEPDSAAQIAVTAALAVAFVFVSEGLSPYESAWDSWVSRCGHVVVFLSMYMALLLKVDVADESQHGEKVLEWFLVILNGAMVAAVIVESIIIASSLDFEIGYRPCSLRRRSKATAVAALPDDSDEESSKGRRGLIVPG